MLLTISKFCLARTPATSVVQSLVMKVLNLFLSLGCGMITARALGSSGRGEQSAIILWPYLVSGLAGLGIAPALCYHTSRGRHREGSLLFAASILALVAGFGGAGIGALIVPTYLARYPQETVYAAQLMLLFTPAILLGYALRANLEARGEFRSSNQSRVWPFLFTLIGLTCLWSQHRLTPLTASLAYLTPLAVQTVWLVRDLIGRMSLDLRALRADVSYLLSYGLRSYGTDALTTLSTQVDLAFIIAFLSSSALGLYAVALTAARQVSLLQVSLNMVLLPKASALDRDAALELVERMTRISSSVTLLAALAALVVVPLLIPIFYGSAFRDCTTITRLLIVETLLMGTASVLGQAFNATGRPGIVSALQAGWIVTSVAFLLLLVPRLGLIGAAVALMLSSLIRLIATMVLCRVVFHRPLPRLVPIRSDFRYLFSIVASYYRQPAPT